jgi:hypothetical protein
MMISIIEKFIKYLHNFISIELVGFEVCTFVTVVINKNTSLFGVANS